MNEANKQFAFVIVGLGKTGLSCARYLSKQGHSFAVTDSRDMPPMLDEMKKEFSDIKISNGGIDEDLLLQAEEIVLSPGVSLKEPAIEKAITHGINVIGDLELFCRVAKAPILAVTGSNGKSTVVTLLAEMVRAAGLRVALGGNIGTPMLDMLSEPEPDFYVLELSSFQLETVYSLNAKVSVILNVSEDHMDRYDDIAAYAEAKSRVYAGDGSVIMNRDDQVCTQLVDSTRQIVSFGQSESEEQFGIGTRDSKEFLMFGEKTLIETSSLKIKGEHNYLNALAALAMGQAAGLSMDAMLEALRQFAGLEHRCQWIRKMNGVDWYNDSKGTNVGATMAAINGLSVQGKLVLIAGGVGKDADFSPLRAAAKNKLRAAITYGLDGDHIAAVLQDVTTVSKVKSLQDAVKQAYEVSKPDDAVLLSPACASFDMFSGYEHRGRVFAETVLALREVSS